MLCPSISLSLINGDSSFFLSIAILQFFNKFSTISPGLVILPLLIVVGVTGGKDAYEDVKRHQSDNRVNRSTVHILAGGSWHNANHTRDKARDFLRSTSNLLPKRFKSSRLNSAQVENPEGTPPSQPGHPASRFADIEFDAADNVPLEEQEHARHHGLFGHHHAPPHWRKSAWEDVRVGDFVKIHDNESFPADILICASSEEENVAFVETKNLDGETNLKSRNAVPSLTHLSSAKACAEAKLTVDCDRPDNNMFRMTAAVNRDGETVPVDIQSTLLRGTVLRNTRWVIGLVIFTGEDTKIVLNSGGTPSKRSKVERQMNPQVYVLFRLVVFAFKLLTLRQICQSPHSRLHGRCMRYHRLYP